MKVNGLPVVKGSDLACAGCGTCCTVYGIIDLHITDIFRISEFIGISPEQFFDEYTNLVQDQNGNWTFSLDINGGCRFRIDGRCSIYPVRTDTCALYPFSCVCVDLSDATKREIAEFKQCFVHGLDGKMLVIPDIERTIDSRILFMVKETYMASFDGTFYENEARPFHEKGLALLKNPRMREIVYQKLLKEMMQRVPVNENTKEPVLSEQDIKAICDYIRGI
ncbi:YkgJ family cysteine cluster protein [Methanocella sp. MCL-LM]|uniref:YkgJ family cysteine cluster protein n=1 Tax=Methanocella sp. MCL-LM TaxID=3412035 RepID=UPI003C768EE6